MKCSDCGKDLTEETVVTICSGITPVYLCLGCAEKMETNCLLGGLN